jgi:hypothetical protein
MLITKVNTRTGVSPADLCSLQMRYFLNRCVVIAPISAREVHGSGKVSSILVLMLFIEIS